MQESLNTSISRRKLIIFPPPSAKTQSADGNVLIGFLVKILTKIVPTLTTQFWALVFDAKQEKKLKTELDLHFTKNKLTMQMNNFKTILRLMTKKHSKTSSNQSPTKIE
jgi:hypothetical protein